MTYTQLAVVAVIVVVALDLWVLRTSMVRRRVLRPSLVLPRPMRSQ